MSFGKSSDHMVHCNGRDRKGNDLFVVRDREGLPETEVSWDKVAIVRAGLADEELLPDKLLIIGPEETDGGDEGSANRPH